MNLDHRYKLDSFFNPPRLFPRYGEFDAEIATTILEIMKRLGDRVPDQYFHDIEEGCISALARHLSSSTSFRTHENIEKILHRVPQRAAARVFASAFERLW